MIAKIILAKPRGFCAGVKRAVSIVEKSLERFDSPIYVRHHIVHNEHVISDLEKKGVIFVKKLDEIPSNSIVIFSAHGVSPRVKKKAASLSLKAIDATCPLVNRVHIKAKKYHGLGYSIILIGKRNHQEVVGITGEAPVHLISSIEDIEDLDINNDKIIYLTQTTLSIDDTKEIVFALKKKFPSIQDHVSADICYATQNRQNAVKELAKSCDLILVVGSQSSSNSKRLVETAKHHNVNSYLIPDKEHINPGWFNNIKTLGVTSGASVPEFLVTEVLNRLREISSAEVETLQTKEETISFSLPEELN